jgi:hypothetical protein
MAGRLMALETPVPSVPRHCDQVSSFGFAGIALTLSDHKKNITSKRFIQTPWFMVSFQGPLSFSHFPENH